MAQVMKNAGYRTAMVGKWDAGMATPEHTPRGRGFDTSFGYFVRCDHMPVAANHDLRLIVLDSKLPDITYY